MAARIIRVCVHACVHTPTRPCRLSTAHACTHAHPIACTRMRGRLHLCACVGARSVTCIHVYRHTCVSPGPCMYIVFHAYDVNPPITCLSVYLSSSSSSTSSSSSLYRSLCTYPAILSAVCLSVCLSVCLPTDLSIYLRLSAPASCPLSSVRLSVCVCPSPLSVCLDSCIRTSVCVSVCLSRSPFLLVLLFPAVWTPFADTEVTSRQASRGLQGQ